MKTGKEHADVLIVGAGPTGLTLACDLARRGIAYRIIDQDEQPSQHSKALAIHARTLECFEQLGLTDELCRRGRKIHALNLYADGRQIARLDFQHLNTPYPFVLVLPQRETEGLLIERLTSLGGTVERPIRLSAIERHPENITAIVHDMRSEQREDPVSASWLVGCDGAHSSVRTCLTLPFEGEQYVESFLLGDLTIEGDLPSDEGHIFLSPSGVLFAIPLPNPHRYRVVIDATQAVPHQSDSKLVVQDFQASWTHRVGNGPGSTSKLSQLVWHSRFRISRRLVSTYRRGRVFLAGDAAHIHSPAGGQGMNTGIQDAFNLGWKLALVNQGLSPESLLDSYEVERRPIAASILAGTHWGTKMMTVGHPLMRWGRNHLASLLNQFPTIQDRIVKAVAELDTRYPDSDIIIDQISHHNWGFSRRKNLFSNRESRPCAGERAPNVILSSETPHEYHCLFDVFQHQHHTLLFFQGLNRNAPSIQEFNALHSGFDTRFSHLVHSVFVTINSIQPHISVAYIRDSNGVVHRRYGADQCCVYVIRPDGYVGYTSQPTTRRSLEKYFSHLFR
ncbi:FAD-dependent monooxygenase [Candidatus Nitrospira salsa]